MSARVLGAVALLGLALAAGGASGARESGGGDWPVFGYNAARTDAGPASAITAANVGTLRRQQVQLPGTVDSSPIYLHGVTVDGKTHNTFFVTTTYGITLAIDAGTGRILWRFTPPDYASFAGTAQITTASPAADPGRTAIYAAAPDGTIRKLSVATGAVLWARKITDDPTHEKLAGALNVAHGLVLAATDGFIGDIPPYQGHVVSLDAASGRIVAVWNALCSNERRLIVPSSCPASDAGIWGRSAPVVDPQTGDLLVATGNAPFNGSTDWGDSVLVLSPNASRLLAHWTPVNQEQLNEQDLDLGSTAPALLAGGYAVEGGKDGQLRLLRLSQLAGVDAKTGGELQTVAVPGPTDLFSTPAVWKGTWVFLATSDGTAAWRLADGRLHEVWQNSSGGTSPVLSGGLLFVQWSGAIQVEDAATGKVVGSLPIGEAHWQSPIVVGGIVAAGEGNANGHATSGVLDLYRLP